MEKEEFDHFLKKMVKQLSKITYNPEHQNIKTTKMMGCYGDSRKTLIFAVRYLRVRNQHKIVESIGF